MTLEGAPEGNELSHITLACHSDRMGYGASAHISVYVLREQWFPTFLYQRTTFPIYMKVVDC